MTYVDTDRLSIVTNDAQNYSGIYWASNGDVGFKGKSSATIMEVKHDGTIWLRGKKIGTDKDLAAALKSMQDTFLPKPVLSDLSKCKPIPGNKHAIDCSDAK